ncbi:MAG: helix-turn-helix transcriptional regulator [Robiginitomaculum sp.]|nr:helix-turn-helix transcriptional regulator [Robiginitomaculum sp.]
MTNLAIKNNLRRLRFDAGEITQAKLAQKVGVTRQTIVALETRQYLPSLELAMKLAAAFGCDLNELFYWENMDAARTKYDLTSKNT